MKPVLRFFLLPAALLSLPASAIADEAPAQCAAPVAPTAELAPWAAPSPLTAGKAARRAPLLAVGQAADLTLAPTPEVKYALRPEKPGGSVSYGGIAGVEIAQAGTYRVALSSGAWIDLVRQGKGGGKAVTSTSHGHGPECSGVRKMVDFPLEPGRYTLQFAANGKPDIRVLVARLP